MKKALSIWLVVLLSFANTVAQNRLPLAYEIKTDTAINIMLDDIYWQMLEDREGKWRIDEVSRPPLADNFHKNTTRINGIFELDYSIKTFWFRYRFKNNMKHEARITIPKNGLMVICITPV